MKTSTIVGVALLIAAILWLLVYCSGLKKVESERSVEPANGIYHRTDKFVPNPVVYMQIGTEAKLWTGKLTTIHCTPDALSPESKQRCLEAWRDEL